MKTKLTIIGIIVVIAIIIYVSFAYTQEIKLSTGMMTSDEKPQPAMLSDPICFVVDKTSSGETGSAVTMDRCFTLSEFGEMGCTKPMLEHLYKYSNLLAREPQGEFVIATIGLPDNISKEGFDKCTDLLVEKRTGNKPGTNVAIEPEIGKFDTYQLQDNNESFEIKYHIQGGVIEEIIRDSNAESLNVMIDGMYDGFLEITIPRTLIDAKIGQSDDDFFVLVDRNQVPFEETRNESERKLRINFEHGTQLIEIIGTNPDF